MMASVSACFFLSLDLGKWRVVRGVSGILAVSYIAAAIGRVSYVACVLCMRLCILHTYGVSGILWQWQLLG